MKAFFSYAIVLSLGLAVGVIVKGPLNLEDVANIKWLDEITVILNKASVSAKPAADVLPIDPAAAALIDEELDYRIAQRLASLEGWRSFLAAHGRGAHAQSARAEAQVLAGKSPRPCRCGGLEWRVYRRESCERGRAFGPALPRGRRSLRPSFSPRRPLRMSPPQTRQLRMRSWVRPRLPRGRRSLRPRFLPRRLPPKPLRRSRMARSRTRKL